MNNKQHTTTSSLQNAISKSLHDRCDSESSDNNEKKYLSVCSNNDEYNSSESSDDDEHNLESAEEEEHDPASSAYITNLHNGIKKRKFSLDDIPDHQVIQTGRVIKRPFKAWKGNWPALREFLQNTIDHLNLMNGDTGRRQEFIDLKVKLPDVEQQQLTGALLTVSFVCRNGKEVCRIQVLQDELIIDQLYTYPLASRALDTGVPDSSKTGSDSKAGGFGDGFKTAAVALMGNKQEFKSLIWSFYATKEKTKLEWVFEGITRERVATFKECQVLVVKTQKKVMERNEMDALSKQYGTNRGSDYIMRQKIQVKGVGTSFIHEAMPRLVVFWDLNESTLIKMSQSSYSRLSGGDFIGPADRQPALLKGILNSTPEVRPCSGIYVKGIYVCPSKIKDTIMGFYRDRLDVSGRDRNNVDNDSLVNATVQILKNCDNVEYLRKLLLPLCGVQGTGEIKCLFKRESIVQIGSTGGKTWLLQSPRFFNLVVERLRNVIIYNIFGLSHESLFVKKSTIKTKNKFFNWAAPFLNDHGKPLVLVPIEKRASEYLFSSHTVLDLEEFKSTLKKRCVSLLLSDLKENKKTDSSTKFEHIFHKLLSFMGKKKASMIFSCHIKYAFTHDRTFFLPETDLNKILLSNILNDLQFLDDDIDREKCFSCQIALQQLSKDETRKLSIDDIEKIIKFAKEKYTSRNNYLQNHKNACEEDEESEDLSQDSLENDNDVEGDIVSHDSLSGLNISIETSNQKGDAFEDVPSDPAEKGNTGTSNGMEMANVQDKSDDVIACLPIIDLEDRINEVCQSARSRKRAQNGEEKENYIIPASNFVDNKAAKNSCIRRNSSLAIVPVDETCGGDSLWCDKHTSLSIQNGSFDLETRKKISTLRVILEEASSLVEKSIPSLRDLLTRIKPGYDFENDTYEAFCDGECIIVNLFAFMSNLDQSWEHMTSVSVGSPMGPVFRPLIHNFIITITHHIVHVLEPNAGHGPIWSYRHKELLIKVMKYIEVIGIPI